MSTTTEHEEQKKGRRYLSKPDVMRRYAWISAISVDRAVERKTIPAPIYVGRRPLWLEEELDARRVDALAYVDAPDGVIALLVWVVDFVVEQLDADGDVLVLGLRLHAI